MNNDFLLYQYRALSLQHVSVLDLREKRRLLLGLMQEESLLSDICVTRFKRLFNVTEW